MPESVDQFPALLAMEAVPLFRDLGYRFTAAGEGWAEITFDVSPRTLNLYGIVHGGAWLFLADSAMGGALGTVARPDERVITAQAEFRWLRPLQGATIRARARVLRRGRTLSHCAVELFDADGVVIGVGNGTYVILPPETGRKRRHPLPGPESAGESQPPLPL
ncbi:MAG: PaaI family thioesterase [Dehalococcoidia bacterium]|nr:PaaI family thioesterase [Dehalococcoidia bacterium]